MIAEPGFGCLWLAGQAEPAYAALRVRRVFPHARRVAPRDRARQAAAVADMTDDLVLVLPERVLPAAALASLPPDRLLLGHGFAIAWMVRNAVTGGLGSDPAPTLWLREALMERLRGGNGAETRVAVVPLCVADWCFNLDPVATLTAGFSSTAKLLANKDPLGNRELALHAALGADAAFGAWWIIGACHALLRRHALADCLELELPNAPDAESLERRVRDLVRDARRMTGIPVAALGPAASRAAKTLTFRAPPRAVYDDLSAIYASLGSEGAMRSERCRRAADWMWGTDAGTDVPSSAAHGAIAY